MWHVVEVMLLYVHVGTRPSRSVAFRSPLRTTVSIACVVGKSVRLCRVRARSRARVIGIAEAGPELLALAAGAADVRARRWTSGGL